MFLCVLNAVTIWDVAKWPVLVLVVGVMLSILYYASPNVRQPGFRWVTPGGVLAVVLWIVASAAFGLYVAAFGSYNKTYGSLGAIIVFLVWLWLTNVAVLLGAELNAELERGKQIEAGHPPDREPFLPPRTARRRLPVGLFPRVRPVGLRARGPHVSAPSAAMGRCRTCFRG